MKTQALLSGICLVIAPWAAGAQSTACCESQQPAARTVTFSPMSPSSPMSLSLAAAPARAQEKGMLGVYLTGDDGRAKVERLVAGGSAEQAGLKSGDRIVAVDGEAVKDAGALVQRMQATRAGQQVTVTVERDGWRKDFEFALSAASASSPFANVPVAPQVKGIEGRVAPVERIYELFPSEKSEVRGRAPLSLRLNQDSRAEGSALRVMRTPAGEQRLLRVAPTEAAPSEGLRELREQLDELRAELRELRQALRRVQAGVSR